MDNTHDYQVGDCVRLTRNLPMAGAGTEGVVKTVVRDEHQQVKALTILVADGDNANTFGTTVFPCEVEIVQRSAQHEVDDR